MMMTDEYGDDDDNPDLRMTLMMKTKIKMTR